MRPNTIKIADHVTHLIDALGDLAYEITLLFVEIADHADHRRIALHQRERCPQIVRYG